MGLSFGNPLALWALLGIPAILLVHMLQSRNRTVHASTLFLLEHLNEDTRKGAVVTRIRNGAQLWLQLLAVLLLTILLSQPRRISEHSVQSLALVVDSSLSMRAFQDRHSQAVVDLLDAVDRTAARLEWWVLPSDEALPRIGAGEGREALEAVLQQVTFPSGGHDVSARLREARILAGSKGLVVYLTDQIPEQLESGAVAVSLGSPVPNVGISGIQSSDVRKEGLTWQVGVVNPSLDPAERVLVAEAEGQVVHRTSLAMAPGGMQTVEIPWTGTTRGVFRLEPGDAYPADDRWPFVVPRFKPMTVSISAPGDTGEWAKRLVQTVPGATLGTGGALEVRAVKGAPVRSSAPGDLQVVSGDSTGKLQRILPEPHPLVEGLNWEGLLVEPVTGVPMQATDTVLLWMGEDPLVFLRPREDGVTLIYLFDPEKGNALRNSSLALLTHRFFTTIQQNLEAPYAVNALTGQPIQVPEGDLRFVELDGEVNGLEDTATRWPHRPGWATVVRDETQALEVGVANGEVEEGDFRNARPQALSEEVILQQREQNEEADVLFPLWAGLLGAALIASWHAGRTRGGAA